MANAKSLDALFRLRNKLVHVLLSLTTTEVTLSLKKTALTALFFLSKGN